MRDDLGHRTRPRLLRASSVGLLAGPLLFALVLVLPADGLPIEARRTLAVTALVATWWLTQAIPIAATSLLPLVLFPLLSVARSGVVARRYADDAVFLFLGGFVLAIAIEECGLHRRISLAVLRWLGTTSRRLSFSFMVVAALGSAWISNTATALMLLPVGLAVTRRVGERLDPRRPEQAEAHRSFTALVLLSIAYGASLGGLATPIGTPPNVLFRGLVATSWPDRGDLEIGFATWMAAMVPLVAIFLPLAWLVLDRVVFRSRAIDEVVSLLHGTPGETPGPLTRDEKVVGGVFVATAAGWVLRSDIELGALTIPGWADLLGVAAHVDDATVAIAASVLLFVLPSHREDRRRILDWSIEPRIPWGILLLFGGGFAIAGSFQDSGLAAWLGETFSGALPDSLTVAVASTCLLMTFLTEVTSNTATAAVFLPIMGGVAEGAGLHPFALMLPATISASCAFMLPVATPPNAIVFGSGEITMGQMARAGILLNLLGALLVTLFLLTWWRWLLWP